MQGHLQRDQEPAADPDQVVNSARGWDSRSSLVDSIKGRATNASELARYLTSASRASPKNLPSATGGLTELPGPRQSTQESTSSDAMSSLELVAEDSQADSEALRDQEWERIEAVQGTLRDDTDTPDARSGPGNNVSLMDPIEDKSQKLIDYAEERPSRLREGKVGEVIDGVKAVSRVSERESTAETIDSSVTDSKSVSPSTSVKEADWRKKSDRNEGAGDQANNSPSSNESESPVSNVDSIEGPLQEIQVFSEMKLNVSQDKDENTSSSAQEKAGTSFLIDDSKSPMTKMKEYGWRALELADEQAHTTEDDSGVGYRSNGDGFQTGLSDSFSGEPRRATGGTADIAGDKSTSLSRIPEGETAHSELPMDQSVEFREWVNLRAAELVEDLRTPTPLTSNLTSHSEGTGNLERSSSILRVNSLGAKVDSGEKAARNFMARITEAQDALL